ncbi:hypothetical protein [Pseudarthrobacter cellobiosi]|uniref:hypothetical protein n=1 Tax=Pseudarthrobacter cellobiosi TaxID=2953654 RepID=UPI00208E228D|nr:hypothetical protein [Pseudarthrobacter sp. HLT1-5]MCO4257398.1 hypothetical protein [Pseudarthrobacter sp. HLT1-5]
MTIHVSPTNASIPVRSFTEATGWHVDDDGRLHVTKSGGGNIATFHPTAWATVERAPEAAK